MVKALLLCPTMTWTVAVSKESLRIGKKVNGGMGITLVDDIPSDSRLFAHILGRLG